MSTKQPIKKVKEIHKLRYFLMNEKSEIMYKLRMSLTQRYELLFF